MEKKTTSNKSSLNQKVINNYKSIQNRSVVASIILLFFLSLGCAVCFQTAFKNDNYKLKISQYKSKISELNKQKQGILDGTIQTETIDFDDVLSEKMDSLGDYPTSEDNYQVDIKDTQISLEINKNNVFVSDNANMLNDATKKHIYELNKQLAASTDGAQLNVVTVKDLDGESVESLANTIFNQLGIGNAEEKNGVLYFIALEDQEFRLEVGYGLEGTLTDSVASNIIEEDETVGLFQDKKYDQAVLKVTDEVFNIMNSKTALVDSQIDQVKNSESNARAIHYLLIIGSIVIALVSLLLIILLFRTRKELKEYYANYESKLSTSSEFVRNKIIQDKLYYLYKSGMYLPFTIYGLERAIIRGKLLSVTGAQAQSLGRVLIGDTLYSGDGSILTSAYLMSQYNPSNSSSGSGSSSSGSSWGSFGGGSSGGGGASGGW